MIGTRGTDFCPSSRPHHRTCGSASGGSVRRGHAASRGTTFSSKKRIGSVAFCLTRFAAAIRFAWAATRSVSAAVPERSSSSLAVDEVFPPCVLRRASPVRGTDGPVSGFWDCLSSRDMSDAPSVPFGPSSTRGGTSPTSSAPTASVDFSRRRRPRRRPFRREARSPRVGTPSFTARTPDLRRRALATSASRFIARSPCSAPPRIQFSCIAPRLRSSLLFTSSSRLVLAARRSAVRFVWL